MKSNGHDELSVKIMLSKPITPLSRLIGEKWFLPLEKLAKEADVNIGVVKSAVQGKTIRPWFERKIRAVLEKI